MSDSLFFVDETDEDLDSEIISNSVLEKIPQKTKSVLKFVEKDVYLNNHLIEVGTSFEIEE